MLVIALPGVGLGYFIEQRSMIGQEGPSTLRGLIMPFMTLKTFVQENAN